MHRVAPGDDSPEPSPHERTARALRAFPEPVAIVRGQRPDARVLVGFQSENGRPFSIQVTYLAPDGGRLLIRTKPAPPAPDPDRPPPFVTVDTLHTAFGIHGSRTLGGPPPAGMTPSEREAWSAERIARYQRAAAEYEAMPRRTVQVEVDGAAVSGLRIDYPECSGVELDWDGRTVQCVGTAEEIDGLALRGGSRDDLAAFIRP
jgi:hypothetical protein